MVDTLGVAVSITRHVAHIILSQHTGVVGLVRTKPVINGLIGEHPLPGIRRNIRTWIELVIQRRLGFKLWFQRVCIIRIASVHVLIIR